jgi:hypothetical protein
VTGKYGMGLSFNGTNSMVSVADAPSLDLTNALTIEAWVKPSTLGSVWRTVAIKEQSDQLSYALYANNGKGRSSSHEYTDKDNQLASPASLPLDTWSHLATTWDGTTTRLYVNGREVASAPLTGTIRTSANALRFGGNQVWNEWFKGSLDEIRIYNRALSPAEIVQDRDAAVSASALSARTAAAVSGSKTSTLSRFNARRHARTHRAHTL